MFQAVNALKPTVFNPAQDPSRVNTGYTIPTTSPTSRYSLTGLALTGVVLGGCYKASPVSTPQQATMISREECVAMNNNNNHISAGTGLALGLIGGLFFREIILRSVIFLGKSGLRAIKATAEAGRALALFGVTLLLLRNDTKKAEGSEK